MIAIPEILDGMIEFSDEGEIKLKDGATPEQKKEFKSFLHELDLHPSCVEFEDPLSNDFLK